MSGDRACMNITLIEDDIFEKNETFNLEITVVEENIDIMPPSDIPITIVDNDRELMKCKIKGLIMVAPR